MRHGARSTSASGESAVAKWQDRLAALYRQVRSWVQEQQWLVQEHQQEISCDGPAPYPVGVLHLDLPDGKVVLEPVSMQVPGWEGRVDLYAWPSLNRVRLLAAGDDWVIYTDSNVRYGRPWGRDTFVELARELAAAP